MSRLPVLAAACGAVLLTALPAAAQEQGATIVVTGEGRVEAAPDRFILTAEVEGRGADQAEAVRRMTEAQTAVTDGVTRLRGLTGAEFTTGLPAVTPVFAPECRQANGSTCAPSGYVATLSLRLEATPTERAGDAVSLAAERGARTARLGGYLLSDETAARRDAMRAAYVDAERQAQDIAAASGRRITGVVRADGVIDDRSVSRVYGANLIDANAGSDQSEFDVPATSIGVTPAPLTITRRLTVTFAIE